MTHTESHAVPDRIDLEVPASWPQPLAEFLTAHHGLFLDWEISGTGRVSPQQFDRAIGSLADLLASYAVIGWHCTRLTQAEIEAIRLAGMGLPDAVMLSNRIDALLDMGRITPENAALLKSKNQAHEKYRAGRLWFCFFPPSRARESGIGDFFRFWGGEALYNSHDRDPTIAPVLQGVGTPCIVEADIPIAFFASAIGLAFKIVRRFLISRGYETAEPVDHEDRIVHPLPATCIRQIVSFPSLEFQTLTGCDTWHRPISLSD